MGAVTSREGYELQGKNFCEEIFHFFQNDGLPPLPHPPPPKKKKKKKKKMLFWLCVRLRNLALILKDFHTKSSPFI